MPDHIQSSECPEYYFKERCYVRELFNQPGHEQMSIAQIRVEPGTTTVLHSLNNTEFYYILSGSGMAEVAGHKYVVEMGDLLHIAAHQPQRISNTESTDLLFLAICTPRFTPDNYRDLETNAAE